MVDNWGDSQSNAERGIENFGVFCEEIFEKFTHLCKDHGKVLEATTVLDLSNSNRRQLDHCHDMMVLFLEENRFKIYKCNQADSQNILMIGTILFHSGAQQKKVVSSAPARKQQC